MGYKELNSNIIYGLLAHSHSWKGENSKPTENIEKTLLKADECYVNHPIQQLDFITVSDLATWQAIKDVFYGPEWSTWNDASEKEYGKNGSAISLYACAAIETERQKEFFSPISVLLTGLFSRLSWTFKDMRELNAYFHEVNMMGSGKGKMRLWPITIYSEGIRKRIYNGLLNFRTAYDEWNHVFGL